MKRTTPASLSILAALTMLVQAQESGQAPVVPGAATSAPAVTTIETAPVVPVPPDPAPPSAANSNSPLSAGLLAEQSGNLVASAAAYREAIHEFDRRRPDAAQAIFRLGEVYRRLGRWEEAKVQYARVLREFPEMAQLAELSHAYLLNSEPKPSSGYGTGGGAGGGGAGMGGGTSGAAAGMLGSSGPYPGMSEALRKRYGLDASLPAIQSSGTAAPAPEPPQARAERIQCINNLKQLALAARVFATDHQDVQPRAIGEMSTLIGNPKLLHCPSDNQREPASSWADFSPETHMSYTYHGGTSASREPHATLFECAIHHNVALGDGSVQRRMPAPAQDTQPFYRMDPALARRYGLIPPSKSVTISDEMRKRYGLTATNALSSPTQTNSNKR